MKNKGKICATLSMISADGRHIEIHFTDKAEARATMDALESGVIPRQDLDHAVADIAYRLNAEHYGSKELAALAWLAANPDEFCPMLREAYNGMV